MLASSLKAYKNDENVIVLAIPRGGIVLGHVVAGFLNSPLDIMLVKKIGHPMNKELAIGAVSMTNSVMTTDFGISLGYIKNETKKARDAMETQYELFFGDRKPISLKGKKVIIIDDGIASGNTLLVVLEVVKKAKPAEIIVAVPVAPHDIAKKLKSIVDNVVCLELHTPFYAVSLYYKRFDQVENNTVVKLLNEYN